MLGRGRRDVDSGGGDGVVEGQPDDDVMDVCVGRERVEERLPLEQRVMADFFKRMFGESIGSCCV